MATQIKIVHNGKPYDINLAKAADLIGMAQSTFSAHWRRRVSDDDQESFDHIKSCRRGYVSRFVDDTMTREERAAEKDGAATLSANSKFWRMFNFERAILEVRS